MLKPHLCFSILLGFCCLYNPTLCFTTLFGSWLDPRDSIHRVTRTGFPQGHVSGEVDLHMVGPLSNCMQVEYLLCRGMPRKQYSLRYFRKIFAHHLSI